MQAQRERILRATLQCIARKGAERTSIAEICREAGLSAGAIYLHFANKETIIAETLSYGTSGDRNLPQSWAELVKALSSLEGQKGFDIETVVRARLNLQAESAYPGKLHDAFAPIIEESLQSFASRLQEFADRGEIKLRSGARETALHMMAFIDGAMWLALARDRPLDELKPHLATGISCFVEVIA